MSFLVLLILIAVEKLSNGRRRIQKDSFWLHQLQQCENQTSQASSPNYAIFKLTILPVIIIGIIIFLLHNVFHGIFLFFIDIAIMLYALGRGDLLQRFGSFRDAWRRDDQEGLKIAAERDLGLTDIESENPNQLLHQAQSKLLWHSYEGFFAVIFWYMLLGPIIPLFYRLIALVDDLTVDEQLRAKASSIRYYLDWLPSRILIYSFCLVGHFTTCFDVLIKELFNKKLSAKELINKAGIAAIQTQEVNDEEEQISSLDILWNLLLRSAILWYVIYALFIIFIY